MFFEKKQKTRAPTVANRSTARAQGTKIFCFFFSKKKALLTKPTAAERIGEICAAQPSSNVHETRPGKQRAVPGRGRLLEERLRQPDDDDPKRQAEDQPERDAARRAGTVT